MTKYTYKVEVSLIEVNEQNEIHDIPFEIPVYESGEEADALEEYVKVLRHIGHEDKALWVEKKLREFGEKAAEHEF